MLGIEGVEPNRNVECSLNEGALLEKTRTRKKEYHSGHVRPILRCLDPEQTPNMSEPSLETNTKVIM